MISKSSAYNNTVTAGDSSIKYVEIGEIKSPNSEGDRGHPCLMPDVGVIFSCNITVSCAIKAIGALNRSIRS